MKKLRVTWFAGRWSEEGEQTAGSADLPENVRAKMVGESLEFYLRGSATEGTGERTVLILPESRLVSAVQVDVPDA